MSPVDIRASAARAIDAVRRRGRALDEALQPGIDPLLAELAYGTCRRYYSLCSEVDAALDRPLRARDQDLYALMLVGAYQLRHTRIPDHAAVSETVAAARQLRKPWARRLINGVLRRISRTQRAPPASKAGRWDHPEWLIDALHAAHPQACPELLSINNSRAPMALSVNRTKTSVEEYRALLDTEAMQHRPGLVPDAIVLETPTPTAKLPRFDDGWISVQDEGAQLAAWLLDHAPGASVLDACAAPGGKAFALLARDPTLELTALDRSESRLVVLRRESDRLGHRFANVLVGDATADGWWDGRPFDAILLDAPCSGTGTLRRHPDIKVSRRPEHVARAAERQRALLANLWPMLSSGGTLLYCTCSILPDENDDVVTDFVNATPDVSVRTIQTSWGRATETGRVLLPSVDGPDGFFYALLCKE